MSVTRQHSTHKRVKLTPRKRRSVLCLTALLFLYFLFWNIHQRKNAEAEVHLSFDTCGGFSNQLLAVAFVLTYSVVSGVSVLVSPSMNMNGRQVAGVDQYSHTRSDIGFGELFEWSNSKTFLQKHGISLVSPKDLGPTDTGKSLIICKSGETLDTCTQNINRCQRKGVTNCNVHVECPFIHPIWKVDFLKQHKELFEEALNILTPSNTLRRIAESAVDKIRYDKAKHCLTFVHLRVEMDWQEHCKNWLPGVVNKESINCLVTIPEIIEHVQQMKVSHCITVIAYDADDIDVRTRKEITRMKSSSGLMIVDLNDILPSARYPRELRAGAAALIAREHSDFFVGNSVSTLSAVLIRYRRRRRLWAAQYNRGPIPLSEFVPGFPIPWVFAVRGNNKGYDEMMKVAVHSAIQNTALLPYVMVHPDEINHDRVKWLRSKGVQVCIHRPTWEPKLLKILRHSSESARRASHLYSFPDMVLGTFFRLDIAVLPDLLQFEHVLYTDTDVLFRNDITEMQGEGLKLPSTIQLAIETPNLAVLNAGVYFASLRFLKQTHAGLIRTLVSNKSIDYGSYGPGDQGLLNKFYEGELKKEGLLSEELFNAKAYSATKQAKIVHFHGPKPSDYEEAAQLGSCTRFPVLCNQGLRDQFFCELFNTWMQFCPEEGCHYPHLRSKCREKITPPY